MKFLIIPDLTISKNGRITVTRFQKYISVFNLNDLRLRFKGVRTLQFYLLKFTVD